MGVERAVTRWYVQRQRLLDEIAQLEGKLVPAQRSEEGQAGGEEAAPGPKVEEVQQELTRLQVKLRLLGPCPKPMMG